MIRLTVLSDGSVTGDVGRIIAYDNQTYSDYIQITHPQYSGAIYKVVYQWGHTQFVDLLDSNDKVRIHIHGAGTVTLQFVAENALTGQALLTSKPVQMVIHKSVKQNPYSFTSDPCGFNGPCCPPPSCSSGDANYIEMMVKQGIELAEEESIRASQDSLIWEEIYRIKDALTQAGISTGTRAPEIYDINTLTTAGEYICDPLSTNGPQPNCAYSIRVKRYTSHVLQTADLVEEGETAIFYRTGVIENNETTWTEWCSVIHETAILEM